MGLLSSPSASKGLGKAILLLSRIYQLVGLVSYIAGVVCLALLAHNDFNGKSYYSENALQPGVAASTISQADLDRYGVLVKELGRSSSSKSNGVIPVNYLTEVLSSVGLEAHRQNFSVSHPFAKEEIARGQNVYGIARAPRIASTESVILAAPWREENVHGVALAVTLGALMKRQAYWAKDVIVLVVDQEVWGSEAWLQAYHGLHRSKHLQSEDLPASAGSIQAALCLDIENDRFSGIDILTDGINGQMPNLDLVNLVTGLAQSHGGIPVTFNRRGNYRENSNDFDDVQERMVTLLLGAARQASLQPTGIHSSFMRYRIEAMTLKTYEEGHAPYTFGHVASVIEAAMRCINNLLERFHQSFFFYLIAGGERYVSIGMYMPPIGLLLLPLILRGLVLWFSCVGTDDATAADGADAGDDQANAGNSQAVAFLPLPAFLSQVASFVFAVLLFAGIVFISPWAFCSMVQAPPTLSVGAGSSLHSVVPLALALGFIVALPFLIPRLLPGGRSPDRHSSDDFPKLVLCMTIILWLAMLAVVTLINAPFATALALPTVPALLLMPTTKPRNTAVLFVQGILLLAFVSPPSLLIGAVAVRDAIDQGGMVPPSDWTAVLQRAWLVWHRAPVDYELLGIWLYPLLTLCVFPLTALTVAVLTGRATSVRKHEHVD